MTNCRFVTFCFPVLNICLKLNGTHQFMAYADDVNILGGGTYTLKENAGALVAASRETGLEAYP